MIGDIIVIVVCIGVILVFREIDKQNRSFEKIKKFSDKILADFGEYFKNQTTIVKNAGVDLDVRQTQAVAAVKRFEEIIEEFEKRSAQLTDKISIVDEIEKRLATYDNSVNELFEMTERVEENLEKIRVHSNLVHKVSNQLDSYEKQLNTIKSDIPNIITNLEKLNEEKMTVLGSDFSAWVEQRTVDLQTLANEAVDKNEELLQEIKQVYDSSFAAASEKADNFEAEVFDKLKEQTIQRSEEFEEMLTRSSNDLQDMIVNIDEELKTKQKEHNNTLREFEANINSLLIQYRDEALEANNTKLVEFFDGIEQKAEETKNDMEDRLERLNASMDDINELEANVRNSVENIESTMQTEVETLRNQFTSDASAALNDVQIMLTQAVTDQTEAVDAMIMQKLNEAVKNQEDIIHSTLKTHNDEMTDALMQIKDAFNSELRALEERTNTEITRQTEELTSFESNFTRAQEMIQQMDETVLTKQSETKELVDRLQYHLESNASELANMLDDKIQSYEGEFDKVVVTLRQNIQKQTEAISESMDERCDSLQGSFDSRLDEIDSVMSALHDEVVKANNEKTTEFFTNLDAHIKEARRDAEYRLERISNVGQDIDSLETNFRRLIELHEKRINADFEKFRSESNASQQEFEQQSTDSFNALKAGLESINTELNNLKERAYENVSEKLQLFEDDFFSDLSKRSDAMNESLVDWQQEFDTQLSELTATVEKNRLTTESKFAEDMKEHIAATQERYRDQLLRLEDSMKSTEGEYVDRLQQIESNLHTFLEEQRTEFSGAKADAEEYIKAELENYGQLASEKLSRFERDITGQLGQLEQTVTTAQDETSGSLESLMGEIASWRERLDNQFSENKDMYAEKFDMFQKGSQEQISEIEQVFAGEVTNYVNLAREERDSITVDINDLKSQAENSLAMYESRSEEVLEEFKKSYEYMLEDTQKRIKTENTDAEQRVRALKAMVQEVRHESEEMQEKMVLKIQTEANLLKMSMDDVDKKLKQFVAQTQLFEKTDEMKNELENQMTDLRTQLTRFENFKQVTDSIESQFSKIRKLDDETITRMQRLSAEKNRIDALESDFTKLVTLSGSMDQKINDLKSTNDDLQILQLEVRHFQESLAEISGRYDRLEKKTPVLEQTMNEIDKTFENLRELEDRLAACAQETMEIPETVGNLKSDISDLVQHSRSISDIMDKLHDLDTILSSTTKQVAVVEKARDGIVKVEARLSDMIKEAKDQINLYKAVKDGGKKSTPGAPPIAVRENVIRLARQGWKSEQIAQSLNVPRGEVELILDFYGSQNS